MEKSIYQSLLKIKVKYQQLEQKLINPEVSANIKKYTKIIREINNIEEINTTFAKYLEFEENLKDSKEIIKMESDNEMIEFAKHEIHSSEEKMLQLQEKLKILLLPKDPNDNKNVIVEIRGAAGGEEANIFAGDLFRMYQKWASNNKMKIKVLNSSVTNSGGFSQLIFSIEGEKAFSKLKFETGSHRVQRIPKTETQGRIHTSTATVLVMPEAAEMGEIELKNADLKIDTYRSSGAGGQSVNTTDSAVRITHIPTGVVASSQDGKSQTSNKELAMKVLKTRLYDLEMRKKQAAEGKLRKQAGTGDRSEKIRTYNYPQDRITDHRIAFSTSLKKVIDGELNILINALISNEQAEKIKNAGL